MKEAIVTMDFLEKLIRDSERLAVVTNYVKENQYTNKNELCVILGIDKECEE